jgi:hypothetical protein
MAIFFPFRPRLQDQISRIDNIQVGVYVCSFKAYEGYWLTSLYSSTQGAISSLSRKIDSFDLESGKLDTSALQEDIDRSRKDLATVQAILKKKKVWKLQACCRGLTDSDSYFALTMCRRSYSS